MRILHRSALAAALLVIRFSLLHAADELTWQQKEDFLAKAKVKQSKEAKKGVTGTLRITLSDGTITHDAHVQDGSRREPFVDEPMQACFAALHDELLLQSRRATSVTKR